MKPIFSIITVSYNAEHTIARTVQSVYNQTDDNIEYILIDGGSTDHTVDIARKIYPEIKVLSEKDSGIYDAMNKGLHMAQGEYVWFLNAGDQIYDNDIISALSDCCVNALPDIIYGDTMLVDDNNKELGLRRLRPPHKLKWTSFKDGMLVCHQAFIVRRSVAMDYNLKYKLSSDVDWCIRCMKKANSIYNSNFILVKYLHEGLTTANRKKSLIERFCIMTKHYGVVSTLYHHLKFVFVKRR
ncbi:glycosyltransferase family 2 protein [Porphyromonas pogonae]|uniref:glycosyltransferase family 2 protein n=1 Tax=Porphyromonas pogonae TaxID=867595 RepID=UPI002E7A0070|nr:glycosyltransferase family 2 protein [Porphyromonas pogonae]